MMTTLDTREFVHQGKDYRVRIVADSDASPGDYDCYSAEDISAFNNGDWRYVGVILYTYQPGKALEGVTSLWAVEYGTIGDTHIGTDEIVQRVKDEDWFSEPLAP
jgi:hypothetical protein